MTDIEDTEGGYYTVHLNVEGKKIPYIVFARSEYHAARRVREATGYLALDKDVQGPFRNEAGSPEMW